MGGVICSESKQNYTSKPRDAIKGKTKENLESKNREKNPQSTFNNGINEKINQLDNQKSKNQQKTSNNNQNNNEVSLSPNNNENIQNQNELVYKNSNCINSISKVNKQYSAKNNNDNLSNKIIDAKKDISSKEEINKLNDDLKGKNKNIYLNIIYLVDLTNSMKKHKKLIENINNINQSLKEEYKNIIFGYAFYRDYSNTFHNNIEHIEVLKSNASNFNIPQTPFVFEQKNDIYFKGGGDYAEDWANPLNEISKLNLNYNYENIIIHLCDAGAHGYRFSDYDNQKDEENKLIEALIQCSSKKIKIIGLLFNEFSRKSFLECQNIYLDKGGYYNIVDLTRKNLDTVDWNKLIIKYIDKALKKELNHNRYYYNKIDNFEQEFDYIIEDQVNIKNIHMLNLNFIKSQYFKNYKIIQFLPDLNIRQIKNLLNSNNLSYTSLNKPEDEINENLKYKNAIKQGSIGDCYLIAAIVSILFGNVPLIRYIFPYYYNTYEKSNEIYMNVFEDGYRKIISFNNTYPIQVEEYNNEKKYDLCFAKPLNNSFALICLEKGYAVFKSDKTTIKSGFIEMWGGRSENVFRDLFGTNSETIFKRDNNCYDLIKNKIKKYMDYRGFITFSVRFNIYRSGHAFSVIGYKTKINTNEFLVEILNPWHSGKYLGNNIKKQKEYNEFKDYKKKKLFDEEKEGKNIDEKEFDNPELKKSFDDYEKNGYLIMKFDTFYKWIYDIEFTDPMIGCQEYFIEIFPKEVKEVCFVVKNKTKFKAFIIYNSVKMNEEEYKNEFNKIINTSNQKYKLILKNINNNNQYENDEQNDALIYEILDIGNYLLEIINKNLYQEEENYLYIKIQTNTSIDITSSFPSGNMIKGLDYSQPNKFDLTNGLIELKNCPFHCSSINNNYNYKNQNYPPPDPSIVSSKYDNQSCSICVCALFEKYMLIDEIIYHVIKICTYFSPNIKYDFTDILPMNDSNYNYYSSDYVKNPHLYYHYIETIKGFSVIIINKSKFNWNCNSIIEYNIKQNQFIAYFSFGNFKINYDLKIYDFDFKFKNILTSFNYYDSYIYLRQSITIIERLKSNTVKISTSKNINEINKISNVIMEKSEKSKSYVQLDFKSTNYLEKFANNLEKSKINFINIRGSSCYQSATLQGFVHIIFPIAIRNIISNINQSQFKNLDNIDKLKNNNIFNDMIIDILKEINNLQEKGEGSSGYKADKLFDKFPPKTEFHEGIDNIVDSNILHSDLQINSMNSSNLKGSYRKYLSSNKKDDNLIKIINIEQNTIITDVMKMKIEGNLKFNGNLVLKFDENDIKDNNLNVIKLLKKCPQLFKNNYSTKKILLISDIIYMVIDRISDRKKITKQLNINEKIYFNNVNKCFTEIEGYQYLVYELKFILYHESYGHYIAYCKIEDDWYYFNDLIHSFAIKESPPIKDENQSYIYPVILYYVKKK